jgi:2-polyprenyl-6-methoxyphenol hydroxylase-like FAD-dependent oxidoreductase
MADRGWLMLDADVIVVGAGPTGLMLAVELRLAGVDTLVLERHPRVRDVPKAGGLNGQIIDVLRYQGLLERFEAASTEPVPALQLPFGGVHVDFTALSQPPMELLLLPQPQIERVLEALAVDLGAEIKRGQEVVGLRQDDAAVAVDVGGGYTAAARHVVGCDGGRSRVRELASIPFPGTTFPEIQRMGSTTIPDGVTVLENRDLEVEGVGRIPFGFTPTERGVFATGSVDPAMLGVFTSEEEGRDYDDDEPMTVAEMGQSIRRVLGFDVPLGEPARLTRFTYHARQADRYRDGRVFLAGDAAHLFPAGGVALNAGMTDSVNLGWKLGAEIHGWAPEGLLDTYQAERQLAAERTLLHTRAQWAMRRGHDAAADALRELFLELVTDEQPLRRIGELIGGSGTRYPMGDAGGDGLAGTFTPRLDLPVEVAGLLAAGRPVLLDLAGRMDLREAASGWRDRVDVRSDTAEKRPADALLIRPDAYIGWAAGVDEPGETAGPGLRDALARWFGEQRSG